MPITIPGVLWTDPTPTPRGTLGVIRVTTKPTKLILVLLKPTGGFRPLGRSLTEAPGALQTLIDYALKEHGHWSPAHVPREGG